MLISYSVIHISLSHHALKEGNSVKTFCCNYLLYGTHLQLDFCTACNYYQYPLRFFYYINLSSLFVYFLFLNSTGICFKVRCHVFVTGPLFTFQLIYFLQLRYVFAFISVQWFLQILSFHML